MKFIAKTLVIAALAFVGAFAFTSLSTTLAVAHDGEDHSEDVVQAETNDDSENSENEPSADQYRFTAQPGDSYSLIARKAIQIYGIESNVGLSEAEIIAAETWLTQDAGSPELSEGQEVSIDKSAVEATAKRAQELSDESEALWARYAVFADFNTDNVGE